MSTPVGQLILEMAVNLARLQKGMDDAKRLVGNAMDKIRQSANTTMRVLGGLGVGLSVGAFAGWIKGAIDAIDRLNDISAATGITVTKLAGLEYVAKLSGTSLDTVTEASNKLQLGLTTNNAALASIGVTAQDPVEALAQLADVYAATEGQANKAAVANLALGKSWQGVAGLLAQGGDNMRRLIAEGEALSGVTQETADDAAKFNDEIDKLSTKLSALALNIAGPVLKVFSNWIDQLNEGTKAAGGFWKAIGMFGQTNPFLSLEENAAKYRKEVEELTAKQEKYGERASIALGVNDKLAEAAKKLAYFEAMVAIETRKATAAQAEGSSGSNAHVIAYNAMISSAEDLVKQMEIEFSLIGLTNEERAVSIGMRKLEELGIRSGTEAFEKYLNQIIEIQSRIRIKTDAIALSKQAADSAKREAEEYDRLLKSFQDQIAKMQLENETYFDGNAARERAVFLRETENLKIEDRSRLLAQYDEAAAIKDANEQRKKGIDEQLKQQEDYAKEMEKINEQIGQSLTDALMEGGRNAKDLLLNLFKTIILRPLLQPVINSAVGAFTSAGFAGAASAAQASSGGAVGSSLGLVGLANGLKSAYEMVTGGFAQIGSMASSLASTFEVASTYGTGLLSQQTAMLAAQEAGMSTFSAAAGTAASALAGIGAGLMVGNLISGDKGLGGGSPMLTVGGGAAAGALIGSVVPVVGTALGGAIGGIVGGLANAAFGTGKKVIDDTGLKITFNSMGAIVQEYEDWSKKGGWLSGGKKGTELKAVDSELQKYFDTSIGAVALSVRGYTDILKLPARDLTQYSLDIEKSLEGLSPEETKKAIDASIKAYADGLAGFAAAEIAPFQRAGEALSDTLARLGSGLKLANDTLGILNVSLYDTSVVGANAASKLIESFGSVEKFVAATDAYYQNFYTAQERAGKTAENLSKVFSELGVSMPQTNAAFRELVESARAAGDDALFANLIKLAPAFDGLQKSLEGISSELINAANASAAALTSEREGLESRVRQSLGDTAEIRAAELAAVDETNRALLNYIYLLDDQAVQNEKFNSINSERFDLETELLQAQQNTIELRKRELEALDPANRALKEFIYSVEDFATKVSTAIEESVSAVSAQIATSQQAASSAKESARNYYDLADSLKEVGQSIFTQSLGEEKTLDILRSTYLSSLGSAQSGNVDSLKSLGANAQDYLEALKGTAGSQQEFAKQSMLVKGQLNGAAAVATALGVGADYQARLYETNTAMLEVLQDTLQSGNATVEALQEQLGVLNLIQRAITDSATLTVQATRTGSAENQVSLVDVSRQIVGSLDSTTAMQLISLAQQTSAINASALQQAQGFVSQTLSANAATALQTLALTNSTTGQTSKLGEFTTDQIEKLVDIKNVQSESKALTDIVASSTNSSTTYLSAILGKLSEPSASDVGVITQIEAGNVTLASKLDLVVIAIRDQISNNQNLAAAQAASNAQIAAQQAASASAAEQERIRAANAAALAAQQQSAQIAASQAAAAAETQRIIREAQERAAAAAAEQARIDAANAAAARAAAAEAERIANTPAANPYNDYIVASYQADLGRTPGKSEIEYWAGRLSSGFSVDAYRNYLVNSPEYLSRHADGGFYQGGLSLVGEEGPELVNFARPSMIYTAGQTREILSGGKSDGDLASELRALREENRAQSRALVQMQSRMTKMLERWDGNGLPETRAETV